VKLTLAELRKRIGDETDAYVLLEELRWGKDGECLTCPHCGHDKAYFLKSKNGSRITGPVRKDGTRSTSIRRVWKCAKCRKQFSVLTGTVFHGTKVSLATWLTVMVQMCSAKNGISAREIERMHDVTPETAWFILHRLRLAMEREPLAGMLSGTVVPDETFIGGKPKNKHQQGKPRTYGPGGPGRRGAPFEGKTAVLSLIDTGTGEVRSQVVPDVTGATLRKAMTGHVDVPNTTLHTDASGPYKKIGTEFAAHRHVDHQDREYVRYEPEGVVTTNHAEGYFSQLKRSIDGTHHHVSVEHLPRYLAEFDFRYSTRKLADHERLQRMVNQADGRRLTYRHLQGGGTM
jgi:transposase-like protein